MDNQNISAYYLTDSTGNRIYPVAHWDKIDGRPDIPSKSGTNNTSNLILTSPKGQQYKLGVDDNGRLITIKVTT
ncbi:hypothetical protein [Convivina praedatoris]|uniref:Uncharacterized protein n=1 Tax=Convivina praedatoris TaxID=2880963 RepID=A0ABN8H9M4_9LACO|nr:hypothetical protein [Convivina sp. LMG 32447]CAH1853340.1 hypothetical protein R077815_00804 [Convivina sp. LMG 32447]CAH1854709.1 hypothetical protein LMG032447_00918 [Convivina sp. LMG 32447]